MQRMYLKNYATGEVHMWDDEAQAYVYSHSIIDEELEAEEDREEFDEDEDQRYQLALKRYEREQKKAA